MRAIYQDEVDGIILGNDELKTLLWSAVRSKNRLPNIQETTRSKGRYWSLPATSEMALMKVYGLILFDLASASSFNDFVSKLVRTIETAIFDYEVINLSHIAWQRSQQKMSWANFEKWEIPNGLEEKKSAEYNRILTRGKAYISRVGRGMFLDENGNVVLDRTMQ